MSYLPRRAIGAALLLLAASAAHAQYVWIGPNGTRQYSDRPPPPGTPASKIVKAPGMGMASETPAPEAGPAEATSEGAKPADKKGPPTLAEREAAYRERAKQQQEQQLKQQQEQEHQRQVAERCAAARESQAQLDSGVRMARVNADGQKSYMTDEEKAARRAQVNRALQDCR